VVFHGVMLSPMTPGVEIRPAAAAAVASADAKVPCKPCYLHLNKPVACACDGDSMVPASLHYESADQRHGGVPGD
jgi:hypothetical protein